MDHDANTSPEIDVQSVKLLIDDAADFLLLDCRETEEYNFASIPGAKLIPMGELESRVSELEEFRQRRIVVYCHVGGRSSIVTQWLRSQGYDRAQNMLGGVEAWSTVIDPAVPRY